MGVDNKTINSIYTACRELFRERYAELRSTRDKKLLFVDALECELCANAISLCVEYFLGLIDSPAIATSCRSILEARSLLKMFYAGNLDDEQINNFEHQSSLLFYGNLFETGNQECDKILTKEEEDLLREKAYWIVEDYDRAIEAYKKKYGAKFDDAAAHAAVREGLFFASSNPSKSKRKTFTNLFNKYMTDIDGSGMMYKRVSFFAHPWYIDNLGDLNSVIEAKQKDVERCLQIVQEMYNEKINSITGNESGIEHDLASIGNHEERAQDIRYACSKAYDMAIGSNGHISYTAFSFRVLKNVLFEMNILNGLGYPELALSKFQSLCEFWGTNALVNNVSGVEQWKAIQCAFDYSTRIQLHKLCQGFDVFRNIPLKGQEVLRSAYDAASHNAVVSYEDYLVGIQKDSFSFLRPFYPNANTNFLDLTRAVSNISIPNRKNRNKQFMLAYFFSIDVHHATGFCYTENRDCWALLSHYALISIYESFYIFMSIAGTTSDSAAWAARPALVRIEKLIGIEQNESKDLSLKYPE